MKNQYPRVVGVNIRAFVATLCSFAILMMPFAQMAAATRTSSAPTERSTNRTVVNDPPVVTTTAGATSYTQCDPATPVDSGVTVTDTDNATFASATISITNNLHSPEDILSFVNNSPTNFDNIQV